MSGNIPPSEDKKSQQPKTARSWFHRNRSNKGSSSKKSDVTEHRPQISGPIGPVINARGETLNRRDTFGLVEGIQDLVSPAAVADDNNDEQEDDDNASVTTMASTVASGPVTRPVPSAPMSAAVRYGRYNRGMAQPAAADSDDDDNASITTIASTVVSGPVTRPVPPTPMSAAARYGRYNRGMAPPAVASTSAQQSRSARAVPTQAPPRLADRLPGPATNAPAPTSSVFTGLNTPSMQQPTRPAPPVPASPSVAASSSKHDSSSSSAGTMSSRGQNAQDRISLGTIYGIETALTQPITRFNLAESLRKPLAEVPAEEEEEQPLDHPETGPDGPPTIRAVPEDIPEKTQKSEHDEDEEEQKPTYMASSSRSKGKRPAPIGTTPSSSSFLPAPIFSPFMSSSPFLSSPLEDAPEDNDQDSDDNKTKDDSEDEEDIYTADDLHTNGNGNDNDNDDNDNDEENNDLARQFTGLKFHEQRAHVPSAPSATRSVSLAQTAQYWSARHAALRDQELPAAPASAPGDQEQQQQLARTPSAGLQTLFRKRSGNPLNTTTAATPAATTAAAINQRKEEDMRSLRIIARLQTLCTTDAALASLREWQQGFARRNARPALLPPGGTMEDVDGLGVTGSSNNGSGNDDGDDGDGDVGSEMNDENGSGSGSGGRKAKTGGRRRDLMNKILHPRHGGKRAPSPKK